jgi:hypothetical protein
MAFFGGFGVIARSCAPRRELSNGPLLDRISDWHCYKNFADLLTMSEADLLAVLNDPDFNALGEAV